MGHGFLKQTVDDLNTALVFAEQTTVHEQGQAVCVGIHDTVGTISSPGTLTERSETSIIKHVGVIGVISC